MFLLMNYKKKNKNDHRAYIALELLPKGGRCSDNIVILMLFIEILLEDAANEVITSLNYKKH